MSRSEASCNLFTLTEEIFTAVIELFMFRQIDDNMEKIIFIVRADLFIYLFIYSFSCLFIYLFVYLFIYLFILLPKLKLREQ